MMKFHQNRSFTQEFCAAPNLQYPEFKMAATPIPGIRSMYLHTVGHTVGLYCRKLWLVLDSCKRRSVMVHPKVPTDTFLCNRFLDTVEDGDFLQAWPTKNVVCELS